MAEVDLALDCKLILGESPVCESSGRVSFVDINGKSVYQFDPSNSQHSVLNLGQLVGCVVPRSSGGLLAAMETTIVPVDVPSQTIGEAIATVPEEHMLPNFRFNDGKCDPVGRFWVGTMNLTWRDPTLPKGRTYVLDPVTTAVTAPPVLQERISDVGVSNGLAWSGDGRSLFFIDTAEQTVDCFDYSMADGSIANRRTVLSIDAGEGNPDGMCIDSDGRLWVVLGESGTVRQYDPERAVEVMRVKLPVQRPTSCAFGGADLSELYVTTREETGGNPSPHAGGLFRCRIPGVKGASFADVYAS